MYQEAAEGPCTVRELMERSDAQLRWFQKDLRGIWPMLGEGYIAGKREHEECLGGLWAIDSQFGGGIECG